jgi:hypothetical protein
MLTLVVVVLIVVAVRSFHQEARDGRASSTASACLLAASLTETELQHLPVRLVDASRLRPGARRGV